MLRFVVIFLAFLIASQGAKNKDEEHRELLKPKNQTDLGYIIAGSNQGLGNRLRVLASYMRIAETFYDGAHLAFEWEVNEACPGHFLSIFEPIPNVMFIRNDSRDVLDKHAKAIYSNSASDWKWLMLNHQMWGHLGNHDAEMRTYGKFILRPEIMQKVTEYVNKHDMCNRTAMHLRTTDLSAIVGKKHAAHPSKYHEYVQWGANEEPVYLMTDHPKTQKEFLDRWGPDRILVYAPMVDLYDLSAENESSYEKTAHTQNTTHAAAAVPVPLLPIDHRYTSLEHSVIDLFIAAHAKYLKGTPFSSMSEAISKFRNTGRNLWGWCKHM